MDYKRIYDNIITRAQSRELEGYSENHHILPVCMGGSNDKSNLVKLTAREHFIAHWLLYKIDSTPKLLHAWHAMCRVGVGQDERRVNSHHFDRCKRYRAAFLSENSRGENNHFYGKKHTAETRRKLSNIKKAQGDLRSEESIKKWIEEVAKKPKSEEHRKKIGRKGFYMLQNVSTGEVVRVTKDDPRYLSEEWVNPRLLNPEPRHKCQHCDVITTASNIKRWHNENCKHNV